MPIKLAIKKSNPENNKISEIEDNDNVGTNFIVEGLAEGKTIATTAPTASSYSTFNDQRSYILFRPEIYIGSIDKNPRELYGFNFDTKKYFPLVSTLPEGLERLFLEIVSNAADNATRSRLCNVNPGKIEVKMNRTTISITNSGVPIPVEIHETEKVYVPEMIFSKLMSGSNYDTSSTRLLSGINGYGCKLTNIFSTEFKIDIGDNIRGKRYIQTWNNNMNSKSDPIISEYKRDNYVQITFTVDFSRFGMTEYTDDIFAIYAALTADYSFTCKVPAIFNGIEFNYTRIKDYAQLYFPENCNMIVHYEYPETRVVVDSDKKSKTVPIEFTEKRGGVRVPKDSSIAPLHELVIVDTPNSSNIISFVNGMRTSSGGVHVNSAVKAVSDIVLSKFNKPGTELKLKPVDVKNHISILLSCRLQDPKFKSQSKECLSSPTPKFSIVESELKSMDKWQLYERLYAQLELKEMKSMANSDGKKTRHVSNPKLEDANWAGTKKSLECALLLTEGDSAAGSAKLLRSLLPNGNDRFGVMPLKGKILNVMKAKALKIAANAEITNIKEALGLKEGVDYTIDLNVKNLRYGSMIIFSDQDLDGLHIRGLIINYFYCRFPSLIKRGFLHTLRTPIIRIKNKSDKQITKFYDIKSYNEWVSNTHNNKSYKHNYLKGLASNEKDDWKDESGDIKLVQFCMDKDIDYSMILAFGSKFADERKKWITEIKEYFYNIQCKIQNISEFINYELVEFSRVNVHRSIPRLVDGLKISQRKILYALYLITKFNTERDKLKVAAFANSTSEKTNYHYGAKSLEEAIVQMAQNYIGSNNLPYLEGLGNFGTRNHGGKDSGQSRYIYVKPMWWLKYVFKESDFDLLEYVVDEGSQSEPVFFLPIIPTILLNGCVGIATGYSTFVPCYNPLDIINWIINRINGKFNKPLTPWYRGFTGTIILKQNTNKEEKREPVSAANVENTETTVEETENENIEESVESEKPETLEDVKAELKAEEELEAEAHKCKYTMMTYGKLNINDSGNVVITELPIGRWTTDYLNYLKIMITEKKISEMNNYCNDYNESIYFELIGCNDPKYEDLKLIKSYGLGNMTLLNEEYNPSPNKYENATKILEYFYNFRLPYYEKRRLNIIKNLTETMNKFAGKMKLYTAILNGTLIVINNSKANIIAKLNELGVSVEIYNEAKLKNVSNDEIMEFQQEVNRIATEIQYYNNISKEQLWLQDLEEFKTEYLKREKI
jgi:DNA topoisomerase-2